VSGVVVFCTDYRCAHSVTLPANRWSGHVRLSGSDWRSKFRRGRGVKFCAGRFCHTTSAPSLQGKLEFRGLNECSRAASPAFQLFAGQEPFQRAA
jgi:hypothetical protein